MNTQQPSRPVITPAMQEQAKKQPNTWLYVVDPIFTDPNAEVPPWGFIGGYRVDEQGEITDDFSPNPNYRPSPVALRLPAPSNDVERALQLTTTGYAQGNALLTAMLDSELILFAQPQGSGLFTMEHESGRRQLQLFTSENFLPANWTTWQRMTGRQLAGYGLNGIDLQINPTSAVKARMPAEELVKIANTVPPQPVGVPMSPPTGNPAAPPVPTAPAPPPAGAPQSAETEFGRRFTGSMLAGAIGDALGAPVEFYPVDQIRSRFGAEGVTEYDRSGEHAGEFTDDTQLAMFTLEGLIRGHIADPDSFPLPALQLAYQRWLHTQGYNWERAAGPFAAEHPQPTGWLIAQAELFAVRSPNSSCISALREFASVGAPGTFERPINDADNCGGVVRAAPMALWSDDPREVFELAAAAAALTHSKPNGYLPAGVLAVIVHRLLREEPLIKALEQARELLARYRGHEETEQALKAAEELASRDKPTPEQLKDHLGGGWSGHEALAIAVCAALSANDVANALIIATNHSGDSDSTAAICGNIVGAMYGATALPGVWLRDLKQRETLEALVKDALLQFGGTPPTGEVWAARYPSAKDVSDLDFASTPPVLDAPAEKGESGDARAGSETTRATTPVPPPPAEPEGAEIPEPQDASPESDDTEAKPQPVPAAAESVVQPPESAAPRPTSPADLHAQRIRGMLLGAAAGDALGYPIEADSLPEIRAKYGDSGLIDYVDAHHQGGSVSDETQLTLFATDGLIRASIARLQSGVTNPTEQVGYAHLRWLHTQGFEWAEAGGPLVSQRPDGHLVEHDELFVRRSPAATCLQALQGYAAGGEPGSLRHRVNEATDCGALVRVAPAAMWSDDPAEVFWAGAAIASLTHGHPDGHLPAGALAVLVQQLLANRSLPQAVERSLLELSDWDGHEESTTALRRAVELAATGAPTAEQIESSFGDLRSGAQALAIAVCAALTHPESFPEAVVLAANHSGDSDSTAAICGTIMGTAHTAAAIPQHWQDKIELFELITALAADASKAFGPNPPEMQDRYPVNEPAEQQPDPVAAAQPAVEPEESEDIVPQPEPDVEPAAMAELSDDVDSEPVIPQHDPEPASVSESQSEAEASSEPQPVAEPEPEPEPEPEVVVPQTAPEPDPVSATAAPERSAPEPGASHEDAAASDSAESKAEDSGLSGEELRLLAAWRKFRDNEDGNSSELTQGLHKLLVEAFGEERAAQLIGEGTAQDPEPAEPAEDPGPQPSQQERLSGCVFGGAVGDALGAPWVFSDLLTTLRENPDGVREFAEHFGSRGTATGITQQAAFLLSGLVGARLRSADRPTLVRNALRHWLHAQGARVAPPEPGDPLEGFTALHAQRFPDEATLTALARWGDRSENPTPSNPPNDARSASATARGAVVGFETTGPAEAISLGVEIGVLTHGHPDGYFPAAALAGLVNALASGQPLGEAVRTVLSELDRMEGAETTAQALRSATEVATTGPVSPTVLESLGLGFNAPEALAIAVAAALSHPASFDDAVSLAATHAGNSAATAAICGSLLGAERGIAEIPEERVEQLELREVLDRLVADAERARGESESDEPAPEWAARYAG